MVSFGQVWLLLPVSPLQLCPNLRPLSEFGEAPRGPSSIFPGTDGSLYAFVATDAGRPRIEVSARAAGNRDRPQDLHC